MGLAAKHIRRALKTKRERHGPSALTSAERDLLMVSRFLMAIESNTLPELLAILSRSELLEVFDGLSAIGAASMAHLVLETVARVARIDGLGQSIRDSTAIATVARELAAACTPEREAVEIALLKFAFEQANMSATSSS